MVTGVLQTVEREVLVAGEALLTVVLAAKEEVLLQLVTVQYLAIRAATAVMVALGEMEDYLQAERAALAVAEGTPEMQAMEAMAVQQTVVIVDWTGSVLIWAWLVPEEMVAQQTVERAAWLQLGTAVQQPAAMVD